MASNFKTWVDSPTAGQEVLSAEAFATDKERTNGFVRGTKASSQLVNSGLRQANVVVAALMSYFDSVVTLPAGLSLMSTVNAVQSAIAASINKKHSDTLALAQSYTNAAEARVNTKIGNTDSTVASNKHAADASFANIASQITSINEEIESIDAAIADGQGTSSTLRSDLTALQNRVTTLEQRVTAMNTPYERTIAANDWQGSAGNFSLTITAATHGKGKRPSVSTYVNGEQTYDSPAINMTTGDVSLYTNARVALVVVIK